jgi:thioredoxin-like negative regulator of GroEL
MVRQRRWGDADQVYRRALRLYLQRDLDQKMIHLLLWPQVVSLAIDAADLAVQMGDRARAVEVLEEVLARDPENREVKSAIEALP